MFLLNRAVHARFGRVLIGIRENEARMEAIGFPTFRYRLAGFVIAAAIAARRRALRQSQCLCQPDDPALDQSATLVVMVLLGGLGYRYGGVIGATVLLLLEETLAALTDTWHLPLGAFLLAVVFIAPRGLAAVFSRPAR